jgi:thiopeptide-type bacteriocin biosynthesis protein
MKRVFHPGDDWLYMKLYSGPETGEEWLANVFPKIVREVEVRQLVSSFFFLRYADPLFHLRIRFKLKNNEYLAGVLQIVRNFSSEFYKDEMIWKTEIGTYEREMERYGEDWIETAEQVFAIDSKYWLRILSDLRKDEDGENKRWQVALVNTHEIFSYFDYQMDARITLLTKMVDTLYNEMGGGKKLRLQIDQKFRKNNSFLERIIKHPDELKISSLAGSEEVRSDSVKKLPGFIKQVKSWDVEMSESRVSDIIHLSLNRGLRSKHRIHELVIYSFLKRLYISLKARG